MISFLSLCLKNEAGNDFYLQERKCRADSSGALLSQGKDDIARVSHESHRLSEDEHGVETDDGVEHNHARPHQTDDPKADGQDGGLTTIRIIPLIDEPHCEDDLPHAAQDEQPQRYVGIVEEMLHKRRRVAQHHACGPHGQQVDEPAQHHRQALPDALDVEVPYIDVVGNKLSEDDGKVVAQPAIDEKQDASDEAEYPEKVRRHHFLSPLGEKPLHQDATGEERLRQKAYGID